MPKQKGKEQAPRLTRFGDLMLSLESVLEQMIDQHDVQRYELVSLVDGWVQVHRPDAVETYLDGTRPSLCWSIPEERPEGTPEGDCAPKQKGSKT